MSNITGAVYNYKRREENVECHECGWRGKFKEIRVEFEDLGKTLAEQHFCPGCGAHNQTFFIVENIA